MSKSTFRILFYLRKNYLNKSGKAGIMVRLTVNGDMVCISNMTREQGRLVCTWGGNVRELKRLVCMVVLHTEGNAVTAATLQVVVEVEVVLHTEGNAVTADALEFNEMPLAADASLALDDMEEKQIIHVLEQAKGNRTLAVELLGIGRTMLYNKIRLYGIKYKE